MTERIVLHSLRRAYWIEGYTSSRLGLRVGDGRLHIRKNYNFPKTLNPVERMIAAYFTPWARAKVRRGPSNVTPRTKYGDFNVN